MKLEKIAFFLNLFVLIGLSSFAEARPEATVLATEPIAERPATTEELYGMATMSGCSGGLVNIGRTGQQKAVVITNGHCVSSSLQANEAWVNQPSQKSFTLFAKNGERVTVAATKLIYGTLMDTDLALYELRETYDQLAAKNVKAFPLATQSMVAGTPVRVTSGYWERTMFCELDREIFKLIEGFGSDISEPSVATSAFALTADCKTYGGFSGTPIVNELNQVTALLFTGAEGGRMCEERSPCEEDRDGKRTYVHGTSYVARIDQIQPCLKEGELNLNLPNCTLYR